VAAATVPPGGADTRCPNRDWAAAAVAAVAAAAAAAAARACERVEEPPANGRRNIDGNRGGLVPPLLALDNRRLRDEVLTNSPGMHSSMSGLRGGDAVSLPSWLGALHVHAANEVDGVAAL